MWMKPCEALGTSLWPAIGGSRSRGRAGKVANYEQTEVGGGRQGVARSLSLHPAPIAAMGCAPASKEAPPPPPKAKPQHRKPSNFSGVSGSLQSSLPIRTPTRVGMDRERFSARVPAPLSPRPGEASRGKPFHRPLKAMTFETAGGRVEPREHAPLPVRGPHRLLPPLLPRRRNPVPLRARNASPGPAPPQG